MANPTVTFQFTNGQTSDASAVNQNFTDLINAMSDGSKDFTIGLLTANGDAVLKGNLTVGTSNSQTALMKAVFALRDTSAAHNVKIVATSTTPLTADHTITVDVNNADVALSGSNTGDQTITLTSEAAGSGTGSFAVTLSNAAVIAKLLTSFSPSAGTIASTDSILAAFQKIVGNGAGGSATAKSADYTILDNDGIHSVLMTTSSTNRAVTLPAAANNTNRVITVKKVDTGTGLVTVTGTVDGGNFILADQDDFVVMQSDGSVFVVIGKGIGSRVVSRKRDENWAGFGSTNNKISRLETSVVGSGNAITLATSATNGNSYTINQSGLYSISTGGEGASVSVKTGISLNSNQLTTAINSITNTTRLGFGEPSASGASSPCTWVGRLAAADVIRPHCDGNALNNNTASYFDIQKIGL